MSEEKPDTIHLFQYKTIPLTNVAAIAALSQSLRDMYTS